MPYENKLNSIRDVHHTHEHAQLTCTWGLLRHMLLPFPCIFQTSQPPSKSHYLRLANYYRHVSLSGLFGKSISDTGYASQASTQHICNVVFSSSCDPSSLHRRPTGLATHVSRNPDLLKTSESAQVLSGGSFTLNTS